MTALRPMFLPDFSEIRIFSTDLGRSSEISNFTKIRLVAAALDT
jgi:hypothetical protein